jgi:hypothetical protein
LHIIIYKNKYKNKYKIKMDPKMTVALEKVLSKYPGSSQLNFSDPFMWAGAIHYIVTHWHGQPLTHEDIRLAIANHIIMRINRTSRSQPYNTQQRLNPPLYPHNPTNLDRINVNRTIHILNVVLNQYGIPPQPLPFPDVGTDYPARPRPIFRTSGRAPPARPLPPGVTPPVFLPGQECMVCTEEITVLQAQNPGIAFCTCCEGRTHLTCYNGLSIEERDLFFLKRNPSDAPRCPTNRKPMSAAEWYEYRFSPAEIAAALALAHHDHEERQKEEQEERRRAAEIINAQNQAYDEGLRLDSRRWNIEELLERPEFVEQTPEQLLRALTAYRTEYPVDSGITQEEFNAVVERLKQNKEGGKKTRHKKYSKHIKRSNTKRRSYRKKNKTELEKKKYRSKSNKKYSIKRNRKRVGGGRLPVFQQLAQGKSISQDADPDFWRRKGVIDQTSRDRDRFNQQTAWSEDDTDSD